eukprot:XP_001700293.1 basal body protein [Chlamydomonas reinhardtii]
MPSNGRCLQSHARHFRLLLLLGNWVGFPLPGCRACCSSANALNWWRSAVARRCILAFRLSQLMASRTHGYHPDAAALDDEGCGGCGAAAGGGACFSPSGRCNSGCLAALADAFLSGSSDAVGATCGGGSGGGGGGGGGWVLGSNTHRLYSAGSLELRSLDEHALNHGSGGGGGLAAATMAAPSPFGGPSAPCCYLHPSPRGADGYDGDGGFGGRGDDLCFDPGCGVAAAAEDGGCAAYLSMHRPSAAAAAASAIASAAAACAPRTRSSSGSAGVAVRASRSASPQLRCPFAAAAVAGFDGGLDTAAGGNGSAAGIGAAPPAGGSADDTLQCGEALTSEESSGDGADIAAAICATATAAAAGAAGGDCKAAYYYSSSPAPPSSAAAAAPAVTAAALPPQALHASPAPHHHALPAHPPAAPPCAAPDPPMQRMTPPPPPPPPPPHVAVAGTGAPPPPGYYHHYPGAPPPTPQMYAPPPPPVPASVPPPVPYAQPPPPYSHYDNRPPPYGYTSPPPPVTYGHSSTGGSAGEHATAAGNPPPLPPPYVTAAAGSPTYPPGPHPHSHHHHHHHDHHHHHQQQYPPVVPPPYHNIGPPPPTTTYGYGYPPAAHYSHAHSHAMPPPPHQPHHQPHHHQPHGITMMPAPPQPPPPPHGYYGQPPPLPYHMPPPPYYMYGERPGPPTAPGDKYNSQAHRGAAPAADPCAHCGAAGSCLCHVERRESAGSSFTAGGAAPSVAKSQLPPPGSVPLPPCGSVPLPPCGSVPPPPPTPLRVAASITTELSVDAPQPQHHSQHLSPQHSQPAPQQPAPSPFGSAAGAARTALLGAATPASAAPTCLPRPAGPSPTASSNHSAMPPQAQAQAPPPAHQHQPQQLQQAQSYSAGPDAARTIAPPQQAPAYCYTRASNVSSASAVGVTAIPRPEVPHTHAAPWQQAHSCPPPHVHPPQQLQHPQHQRPCLPVPVPPPPKWRQDRPTAANTTATDGSNVASAGFASAAATATVGYRPRQSSALSDCSIALRDLLCGGGGGGEKGVAAGYISRRGSGAVTPGLVQQLTGGGDSDAEGMRVAMAALLSGGAVGAAEEDEATAAADWLQLSSFHTDGDGDCDGGSGDGSSSGRAHAAPAPAATLVYGRTTSSSMVPCSDLYAYNNTYAYTRPAAGAAAATTAAVFADGSSISGAAAPAAGVMYPLHTLCSGGSADVGVTAGPGATPPGLASDPYNHSSSGVPAPDASVGTLPALQQTGSSGRATADVAQALLPSAVASAEIASAAMGQQPAATLVARRSSGGPKPHASRGAPAYQAAAEIAAAPVVAAAPPAPALPRARAPKRSAAVAALTQIAAHTRSDFSCGGGSSAASGDDNYSASEAEEDEEEEADIEIEEEEEEPQPPPRRSSGGAKARGGARAAGGDASSSRSRKRRAVSAAAAASAAPVQPAAVMAGTVQAAMAAGATGAAGTGGAAEEEDGGCKKRSSQYRGVTRHRRSGRWEAHIWVKEMGRQVYLGGYEEEAHAAEAYDVAALKCKGAKAGVRTNFELGRYSGLLASLPHISLEELIMAVRRQSQGFSRGSSSYRGVTAHPSGRWESRIGIPGSKHIYLGLFEGERDAAAAYDRSLVRLKGPTAATNFSLSEYRSELSEFHVYGNASVLRDARLASVTAGSGPDFEKWIKSGFGAFPHLSAADFGASAAAAATGAAPAPGASGSGSVEAAPRTAGPSTASGDASPAVAAAAVAHSPSPIAAVMAMAAASAAVAAGGV